ncbi:hypothetical protein KKF84_14715, partial [Myxococcota bacterium]|nr:hypothetical protein [Myxococcota bacterium]
MKPNPRAHTVFPALSALLFLLVPGLLWAQPPKSAKPSPAPGAGVKSSETPKGAEKKPRIQYPKLKKFVPAPYPPPMRSAGKEGVVRLALSLDEKGNVVAVTVLVSAGKE